MPMQRLSAALLCVLPLVAWSAACAALPAPPAGLPPCADGPTPHTRNFDPAAPCDATVADLGFLVGRWVGEAFGGVAEETWNPALGGELLGTFRLVQGEQPVFSELMVLSSEAGRIVLRLRHFSHPGLVPWEEKHESVAFPLIEVAGTTAWFGGLTIHRAGPVLHFALAMRRADGSLAEERFELRRSG